jgi:hypothetical protein
MTTATRTRKTRKAPQEIHGTCRWVLQPTTLHPGYLLINGTTYVVELLQDGYRMTKTNGDCYDLPRDLSTCDCPDSVYASERPGGCKHRRALSAALAAL